MYEYTGDPFWKQQAETYTEALESQKSNRGTHDIGFMMYCSFGNGQRLAPNDHYQAVLLKSARSLASRFNPTTGCIRSWDNWGPTFPWQYPVIIDNMMNLELLFWATQATGDSTFYKIAVTHADTTMKNHSVPITVRTMWLITTPYRANESLSRPIRGMPTLRPGHAVRHGVFTAIRSATARPKIPNIWLKPTGLPPIFSAIRTRPQI